MDHKIKAIFILPYFGKLPHYFPLYLISCKYNPNFYWLIITDDVTPYECPENVRMIRMSFETVRNLIQSKFDFPISLKKPYKLCDFRPAFGYIFDEYITGYDFWGHVDPDCIWGDLNKFITWDMLKKYDKLFLLGHLVLYRNTDSNNKMFMRPLHGGERYKDVLSNSLSMQFDEATNIDSINDIYFFHDKVVYEDKNRIDLLPQFMTMRAIDYESPGRWKVEPYHFQYFEWDKGTLKKIFYSLRKGKNTEECSYLHLHGRKMKYANFQGSHFFIFRNSFRIVNKWAMGLISVHFLDYWIAFGIDCLHLLRIRDLSWRK